MIGQQLAGRYLILKQLGVGGFSETYLARDKYLPHHPLCVVKWFQLAAQHAIALQTAQHLFEQEARVLNYLGQHHPQIPHLYAYCQEADQMYIVQEYIKGDHLGVGLDQRKRFTAEDAIALLLEVLPILQELHTQGVIHRDIKPSHLIYRPNHTVALIDFGAAYLMPEIVPDVISDSTANSYSQAEQLKLSIGTLGYMPEEQEQGYSYPCSDIYALGMSVIHLLTGMHPQQFQIDVFSGELNWKSHLGKRPLDPKLAGILDRMVRRRVRDRYSSAAEVLTVLKSLAATGAKKQPAIGHPGYSNRPGFFKMLRPIPVILALGLMGGQYLLTQNTQNGFLSQHIKDWLTQWHEQSNLQLTLIQDLPYSSTVEKMVIDAHHQRLVAGTTDGDLQVWSLPRGPLQKTLSGHTRAITALAMSAEEDLLVSASQDQTVRVWNVRTGKLLQVFRGHTQPITAVAISPDTETIASGDRAGQVLIWSRATGQRLQTLSLADQEITALTYGARSEQLISATGDRQIQSWDLQTGQVLRTFAGHTGAIVNLQRMHGHTLASVGEERVLIWDLQREELLQALPESPEVPVAASVNSRDLMVVYHTGKIRFWSYQSEKWVKRASGSLQESVDVVVSSDHHYLVSQNPRQNLQVWRIHASTQP